MSKFKLPYDKYDLEAGCVHGNHIEDDVFFIEYKDSHPLELLKTLNNADLKNLTKFEYGCGENLVTTELIKILIQINEGDSKSYWKELISYYENSELRPVIVINNELCDGAHRCILMYLKGLYIPTAYFETRY